MENIRLIDVAILILKCTQEQLAIRLQVSSAQIDEWRKSKEIPQEVEDKLRNYLKIEDLDPEFILAAGSLDATRKWEDVIGFIAEVIADNSETGYNTFPLMDSPRALAAGTVRVLAEAGMKLPSTFPVNLQGDRTNDEFGDDFWDLVKGDPYTETISRLFTAFNDVYGFYAAYVQDLLHNDDIDLGELSTYAIEDHLMSLAACKIQFNEECSVKEKQFKCEVIRNYEAWIGVLKDEAVRAGVQIRVELLDLVYKDHNHLGHAAEAESLGINASREKRQVRLG